MAACERCTWAGILKSFGGIIEIYVMRDRVGCSIFSVMFGI